MYQPAQVLATMYSLYCLDLFKDHLEETVLVTRLGRRPALSTSLTSSAGIRHNKTMQLVLFDIDGTLVNTGGAGTEAMNRAFAELYQIADAFANIHMSGKTDPAILAEALVHHQLQPVDSILETFHERYIFHLRHTIQQPKRPRRLMPGIPGLLEALAPRSDVLLGLLTGNFARGAQLKLESFGIWQYFRLGAYGSDSSDRNVLVPVAQERACALLGCDFPSKQTVVIGDTPRDIACAQAHGARVVAVATGNYSLDELQQYRPDYCLADLGDVPAVLRVLIHRE
jgi:phosphoglycolate phosphatase